MDNQAICKVLTNHGVHCQILNDVVYAREVYTVDGDPSLHQDWVVAPTTHKGLLEWLGY